MEHPSHDPKCAICRTIAGEFTVPGGVIWEDELWMLRHSPPPAPLAGWLMLQTRRHVQGPAHFTDQEAKAFGPVLRHLSRALEVVSGAPRIYTIALGESYPHMHAHLVPRFTDLPDEHVAMGITDLFRAVGSREIEGATEAEMLSISEALRQYLTANPPPQD